MLAAVRWQNRWYVIIINDIIHELPCAENSVKTLHGISISVDTHKSHMR